MTTFEIAVPLIAVAGALGTALWVRHTGLKLEREHARERAARKGR